MQMLGRGTACSSGESNHLTGFDTVTHFDKVLGLMAVKRLQTIRVFDNDAIAIAEIRTRTRDNAVESS